MASLYDGEHQGVVQMKRHVNSGIPFDNRQFCLDHPPTIARCRMFPTLGLLSSVRCPDMLNGSVACKRVPCLFSHSIAPPIAARVFPSITDSDNGKRAASFASTADTTRPVKKVRSLFAGSASSSQSVKTEHHTRANDEASTSTKPVGPLRTTQSLPLTKSRFEITGSGKVIKHAIPTARMFGQATTSGTSHAAGKLASASSSKGKEPATSRPISSNVPISAEPPKLSVSPTNPHTPLATRNAMIRNMHKEFMTIYVQLSPRGAALRLAAQHALAQEAAMYSKNNKHSYRNACIAITARLKKRPPASSVNDTGTMEEYDARIKENEERLRTHLSLDRARLLTLDKDAMVKHDYITTVPSASGGNIPTEEGGVKKCDRCGTEFVVHGNLTTAENNACRHHWGRLEPPSKGEIHLYRV